jgi:hypothetical protein
VVNNKLEMGYPFNAKESDILGLESPDLQTLDYMNAGGDDLTPEKGPLPLNNSGFPSSTLDLLN